VIQIGGRVNERPERKPVARRLVPERGIYWWPKLGFVVSISFTSLISRRQVRYYVNILHIVNVSS
jgi:hypothetical protein